MQINVAQLLQEPIGSIREYDINEIIAGLDGHEHRISGECQLLRTQGRILVKCHLNTNAELICSRCLTTFQQLLEFKFEEEYLPTVDVLTGTPLDDSTETGNFTIDEHHILDIGEAIRQYAQLVIPMKPLCRQDCAGLCQKCGKNLNEGPCACPAEEIDPRWVKLTQLI
jgi:uncharacterized protein